MTAGATWAVIPGPVIPERTVVHRQIARDISNRATVAVGEGTIRGVPIGNGKIVDHQISCCDIEYPVGVITVDDRLLLPGPINRDVASHNLQIARL